MNRIIPNEIQSTNKIADFLIMIAKDVQMQIVQFLFIESAENGLMIFNHFSMYFKYVLMARYYTHTYTYYS